MKRNACVTGSRSTRDMPVTDRLRRLHLLAGVALAARLQGPNASPVAGLHEGSVTERCAEDTSRPLFGCPGAAAKEITPQRSPRFEPGNLRISVNQRFLSAPRLSVFACERIDRCGESPPRVSNRSRRGSPQMDVLPYGRT